MTDSVRSALQRTLVLLLFVSFVIGASSAALAQATTGVISGTITGPGSKPVNGAKIRAVAPSGTYSATTDNKGFFSITGVNQDTYTVSITASGYQDYVVNGVTVFAGQTSPINQQLNTALSTIGRTGSRSTATAYQPSVPQNTYNLGPQQMQTNLGKRNNGSETNLLTSLPGATLDSSGYPVLRGGRENEEGFQFEGIDYTDAFTNQFVNTLVLNNPGGFQLTPGAGDASSGNTGTGVINLLTKRGAYPQFGSIDLEMRSQLYLHQLNADYGFATPNGKFSNYTTILYGSSNRQYGPWGTPTANVGQYFAIFQEVDRDVINNAVWKFGRDNSESLQLLYQNQDFEFRGNAGGLANLPWKTSTADPYTNANWPTFLGLSKAQAQTLLVPYPGQTDVNGTVLFPSGSIQPNETLKLQYAISPDSASYYTAKFYKVNAVAKFPQPYASVDTVGIYRFLDQGGERTGFAVDGQRQLSEKHLLKAGAKYEFLFPDFGNVNPVYGAYAAGPLNGNFIADFLPGGYLATNGFAYGTQKIPVSWSTAIVNRQDTALYLDDTYTPNQRLKLDLGIRLDSSNYRFPSPQINPELFLTGAMPLSNAVKRPMVWEPRASFAYQLGRNDAVRGSFATTVEMPIISVTQAFSNRPYYQTLPYSKLAPSRPNSCGMTATAPCANYGEQLYWSVQNAINGVPIQPLLPETFSNYDFSYSHQFPANVAVRVTPFYRRGYNAAVAYATVKTDANGNPLTNPITGAYLFNPSVSSNIGLNRTTGVELYATKDNPGVGLSGTFSATYINEFSNVIPLSGNEDFFPTIPAASALLGKVYRVGFLSPFSAATGISYRAKSGWRFNPVMTYNVGYPINVGRNVAFLVGSTPFSVPNTNVTSFFGAGSANAYVDPNNPGTFFKPNVAATRGTPETNDPGGILSHPRFGASMTIEFSPVNGGAKGPTYGLLISNIFNQLYGQPSLNGRWQPVATGIAGPQTGKTSSVFLYPNLGFANYGVERFGQQPYIMTETATPRTFRFYYQYQL